MISIILIFFNYLQSTWRAKFLANNNDFVLSRQSRKDLMIFMKELKQLVM